MTTDLNLLRDDMSELKNTMSFIKYMLEKLNLK